MAKPQAGRPIAILAGSGDLPRLLAEAVRRAGDEPVIFSIAVKLNRQLLRCLDTTVFETAPQREERCS